MRAGQGLARVVLSRFSLRSGARDRADFRAFHKRVRRRGAGAEGPNSRVARKRQGRAIAASRAGGTATTGGTGTNGGAARARGRAVQSRPRGRGHGPLVSSLCIYPGIAASRAGARAFLGPRKFRRNASRPRARGALRRVSFLPRRADVPRLAGAWQAENAALNFFRPAGRAFAQQNGPLRVFQPGRDGALKPYPTGVRLSGKRLGNCFTTGGGVW